MRKLAGLCAAAACIFFTPAQAAERVVDFHSTVRIAANGELAVTERIDVQVEGGEIKRGIVRDFPTDYRDRFGNRVSVPFLVKKVLRNQRSEPYAIERIPNGVRLRIGRAGAMLPHGLHTYEIRYSTARQVGHFEEHDELYWNVNGSGWTLPFDHISAEVHLPKPVPAEQLRAEAYTGLQGNRGRSYQSMIRDGAVGFTSVAPFAPYEGMTVVVGFPKGVVGAPGWMTRMGWFFSQNHGALAGVVGFALMLAFLYWRWLLVGRDPAAGPAFPRYEAPKGIGPAGVRFIDKQKYDDRCFSSALLGLGSRGYLKIKPMGASFGVEPTGTKVDFLPGEGSVARIADGEGRVIHATYDERIQQARGALERELRLLFEEKVFSKNHGSLAAGVILGASTLGLMFLLDASFIIIGLIGALIVVTLVLFNKWLPAYSVAGRKLEDEIKGLRQYLGVAERDELARQKAPPKTPEEFSKFLPYAVALDVENTWADRFTRVLGAAAVAQAVSGWYDASSDSSFSTSALTRSVSNLGESISSAATPPGSSSGSSGSGSGW